MEPLLVIGIRTSPSLKPFRDDEVTMAYDYKDRNGKFIIEIILTPEKYMGK